ncbi:hypothetical protein N482_02220 [Pseudoalteromonas luteoviolacea NCIMB 1942]|uniref:Transposase IS116/IS110/IS902 C-terminal domain-containing protein n=1 Tax=Pseudoalteromonas luteoviolacea NCIMB 1942 TaxID=1365253 RepID=A0A167BYX8_9GAMM|nr:hypothetical protein N482_02220 [Pseudoalteromonas luteoviolacea NCIMB 1942]
MRYYFPDKVVHRSINLDIAILDCYHKELKPLEHYIEQMAKQYNPIHLYILQTINGIGRILALAIIYEIGDINRFSSVQKFASYSRLVKCKAESASKIYWQYTSKMGFLGSRRIAASP